MRLTGLLYKVNEFFDRFATLNSHPSLTPVGLIDRSKKSLCIATDIGDYTRSDVVGALERALNRGVKVSLAYGPVEVIPEAIKKLADRGGLSLHRLGQRPETHFVVADKDNCYVEQPHAEGADSYGITLIDAKRLAYRRADEFGRMIAYSAN